jgi:hypothetical protein
VQFIGSEHWQAASPGELPDQVKQQDQVRAHIVLGRLARMLSQ